MEHGARYNAEPDLASSGRRVGERTQNIAEALERLPQEVIDARNQRLKRAIDLSLKHTYLSKEMQEKQTPFNFYLQDSYRQVLEEVEERALLGTGKQYERQIP